VSCNNIKLDWTVGYAELQIKSAAFAERERIIKLLEQLRFSTAEVLHHETHEPMTIQVQEEYLPIDLVMAIVKGEDYPPKGENK